MIDIPLNQKYLRSELIEWRYLDRARRKEYIDRDFFVAGRRYRHFASGADDKGIHRYGYLVEEPNDP